MVRRILTFASIITPLLILPATAFAETLQSELLAMGAEDQAILKDNSKSQAEQEAVFQAHTARLKALVKANGWPHLSLVGAEASQAAWLLVQHADTDRSWQREALEQMEALADYAAMAADYMCKPPK